MVKPKVSLILDGKDVFYPGETVRGSLVFQLNESAKAKSVFVTFVGTAYWTYSDGERNSNTYQKYLFKHKITLARPRTEKGESNISLNSGEHIYPFKFTLPSELPTSYCYSNGLRSDKVSYAIEAVIDIEKKFYERNKIYWKKFDVEEVSNLSLMPGLHKYSENVSEKNVRSFFGPSYGTSYVKLSVPRRGYYLGDDIIATVKIDHTSFSNQTEKVTLELMSETKYLKLKKTRKRRLSTIKKSLLQDVLKANTSHTFSEVISVPKHIIPELFVEGCLEIEYSLVLRVKIRMALDIECRFPLTIVKYPEIEMRDF